MSKKHLEFIVLDELRMLCEKVRVVKGGNKPEVIERLLELRISYDFLHKDQLKEILDRMGKPVGGNKGDLIARIVATKNASKRQKLEDAAPREIHVPRQLLNCLMLPMLRDLSWGVGLSERGNKPEVIERLVKQGVSYDQLWISDMKDILDALGEKVSGNKTELTKRLKDCSGSGSGRGGDDVRMSKAHLELFVLPELRVLCEDVGVKKGGDKPKMIERLYERGISYDFLDKDQLKDILGDLETDESKSGKNDLIARIVDGGGGGRGAAVRGPIIPFEGGPMSTAVFRSRMKRAGRPLRQHQDVCHIVASMNGGADHSDNYYIASAAFNRSCGNRHDEIIAYVAGREATEAAVAVSRALNGYAGPGAYKLYVRGEAAMRAARAENRH